LAGQELYSDLKLAENIIKVTESKSKIVFTAKPGLKQESMRRIDLSKIKTDFNFKHKHSMIETILWVSKYTGKTYA
jgi:nucleoside-diphosphate-sugar epimerase